ncbi:MAG: ribose-phosphate pyrophosphokinase [Chloroflexi bacterium]|nr:ribose-phosphate pyrophosphokinase [Chloroflexota bacterium]
MYGDIKLFAGSSTPELAARVAEYLGIPLEQVDLIEFPNENLFVRLHRSVRGQDVYIIQTTSRPVHRNLMELLIMLQTVRLDSAARITAVVPYLCYARSDKKDQPRVPITARLVADMIQVAGADRYITFDLHAGQIQGFFSIPGDVLTAFHLLRDYVRTLIPSLHRPVVVSVDLGFAKKARNFAEALGLPIAFVEKRRLMDGSDTEVLSVVGDVEGRDVILVDDEVDTAGSVTKAYRAVKQHGARDVYLAFVHPVFSDPAVERLRALDLKRIITTDTVPIPAEKRAQLGDRLVVLTIAEMLGEVIRRVHEGRSVGALFNE